MYLHTNEYEYLKGIALGEIEVKFPSLLKVLATIEDRQIQANAKTYSKIKAKRETKPNYDRPIKEWRKERKAWYSYNLQTQHRKASTTP